MSFRSTWRKGSALVLGSALVASAFLGTASVSAQAPPTLPSLAIITAIRDGGTGAAITTGNVSALIGSTVCQTKPIAANLALEVGQPNQPDVCKASSGTISFSVDGRACTETIPVRQGVPQTVTLTCGAVATATPTRTATTPPAATATAAPGGGTAPAPARTGNGGYLGDESGAGFLALGLGAIALAAVGGSLAVRRVRR